MRKLLKKGFKVYEIRRGNVIRPSANLMNFQDRFSALNFLYRFMDDHFNLMVMRDILRDGYFNQDLCRLKNHEIVNQLACQLSSGIIRIVEAGAADSNGHQQNQTSPIHEKIALEDYNESLITQTPQEEKKPEPKIINLKWKKHENYEETSLEMVGAKVHLTADVENIKDGVWARVMIFEKDYDNQNDFISRHSVQIEDGKIDLEWEVIYKEDWDDKLTEEEKETGYTMPEYIFKVDTSQPKCESEDSPLLEVRGFIKLQIIDEDTGMPLPNRDYVIYLTNDEIIKGTTDNEAFIGHENLKWGNYFLIVKDEVENKKEQNQF